jgi:glycerol uptake facilitator-like aquaporin
MRARTRRCIAEGLGTALFVAIVMGSGVMAAALPRGNVALALLVQSLATGGSLIVLLRVCGSLSETYCNPAVTLAAATQGALPWKEVWPLLTLQLLGACAGMGAAYGLCSEPLLVTALASRPPDARWWSEWVAAFGLLMVLWGCVRQHLTALPYAMAAYVSAVVWFTASTSLANPAVTIAHAVIHTLAGRQSDEVVAFVVAQLLGAAAATLLFRWLLPAPLPTDRCRRIDSPRA